MKNRGDFLDEAIAELEENDSLLYIDDNDIVKYKHTESEMQKIVNEGCEHNHHHQNNHNHHRKAYLKTPYRHILLLLPPFLL
jgi:ABC-type Zn2+ transport system substrate-binding protein/surface adhesin